MAINRLFLLKRDEGRVVVGKVLESYDSGRLTRPRCGVLLRERAR